MLSNSLALDKYYDGKGPGAGGWLDPSFLGFCFFPVLFVCIFFTNFGFFFFCRDEDNSKANSGLCVAPPFSILLSVNFCFFLLCLCSVFPPPFPRFSSPFYRARELQNQSYLCRTVIQITNEIVGKRRGP